MGDSSLHTAVVTGGGGGIGRAIAATLAQQGAKVAIADLRSDLAETAAANLRKTGHDALGIALDITEHDSIAAAAAEIEARLGTVDIVVNNAGWDELRPFLETDEQFWRQDRRHQLPRHPPSHTTIPASDGAARLGTRGQHQLGRRARGLLARVRLRRRKGGRDRLHQVSGARSRHRRGHGQCGLPRSDRHAAPEQHGRQRRARRQGHRGDDPRRTR